ncbi:hypothetical protein [Vibrio phage phiKT1024]|nr:hypothetical protein [Vibrio phage phiKT1024]
MYKLLISERGGFLQVTNVDYSSELSLGNQYIFSRDEIQSKEVQSQGKMKEISSFRSDTIKLDIEIGLFKTYDLKYLYELQNLMSFYPELFI